MADESRKQDPELLAMARIGRVLEEMTPEERGRVLLYLVGRWGPPGFEASIAKEGPPCPPSPSNN